MTDEKRSQESLEKLRELLAVEYRKPKWPRKGEWDRPNRYDTMMFYEIGDEVEQAYEEGFDAGVKAAAHIEKSAEIRCDVTDMSNNLGTFNTSSAEPTTNIKKSEVIHHMNIDIWKNTENSNESSPIPPSEQDFIDKYTLRPSETEMRLERELARLKQQIADEKQAHEGTKLDLEEVCKGYWMDRDLLIDTEDREAKLVEALKFYSRPSRHVQGMGMSPLDQIKIKIQIELAHDDGKIAREALEANRKARESGGNE